MIMIFKPYFVCEVCGFELMRIVAFDKINKNIKYHCKECGNLETVNFEEAELKSKFVDAFVLDEYGCITYNCSCGNYCDMDIGLNEDYNKNILDEAYEGICTRCYSQYVLGEPYCNQCGVILSVEDDLVGKYLFNFCSKFCLEEFLIVNEDIIDEEEIDQLKEYYNAIEREFPYGFIEEVH